MKLTKVETDLIVVDGDYLAHRGFYAFTNFSNPSMSLRTVTGIESGCFFGFFSLLLRKIRDFGPKKVIVCWGDRRDNLFRKSLLETYKSNRSQTSESYILQTDDIKKALYSIGYTQYLTPTKEADDLIAASVNEAENLGLEVKIISNDKDFMQLVTDKVSLVTLASGAVKKDKEYFPKDVREKLGVPTFLVADYLSLIGDSSDNIPGISGVGPKTAAKILVDNGAIKNWFNSIWDIKASENVKRKLFEGRDNLLLNKKLISLSSSRHIELVKLRFDSSENYGATAEVIFNKYEMQKIRPDSFILR